MSRRIFLTALFSGLPATLLVPLSPLNVLEPSVAEAATTLTYAQTVLADNPVSYWRLNDRSGTTAVDSTGRNNGRILGGVTLNQPGPVAGGGAMKFDGSTGYISIGDPTTLKLSHAMTLEAWVLNPGSGPQAVVSKWAQNAGTDAYGQYLFNSGHLGAVGVHGVPQSGVTSTAVPSGQWVHLAVTYDVSTSALVLYMNGTVEQTGTVVGGITVSDANVNIGKEDSSLNRFFSGTMSEVAVYDHALSVAQLANHYQAAQLGGDPRCQSRPPDPDGHGRSAEDQHRPQPVQPDPDERSGKDRDDLGPRCPGTPAKHALSSARPGSTGEAGDAANLGVR